jgi:hypothetical protein
MNKLRIIILVGVGISLLYSLIKSIVLRMPGRSRGSARKRMAQAQWLDADSRLNTRTRMSRIRHERTRWLHQIENNSRRDEDKCTRYLRGDES